MTPVEIERFDEYLLFAKLSDGPTAHVFLGLHQGALGARKLVAIKRMRAHLTREPREFELFCQEANLASAMQHPHIVQTHKVGIHRGQPFLVMEYLDGQSLAHVLRSLREGAQRFSPVLAAQIASRALDALGYLHRAVDYLGQPLDAVHCDVSPHNLFVTYDGTLKLIDFGVARVREQHHGSEGRSVRGHAGYVAPEQARREEVDARADVWGVGVSLWECLVGRRLFRGDSDLAVLRAATTDDVPPVNELAPNVSEELSGIVEHALQRNRERRFESTHAFKQALDDWLRAQRAVDVEAALERVTRPLFTAQVAARSRVVEAQLARVEELLARGHVQPGARASSHEARVHGPPSVPPSLPPKRAPSQGVPAAEPARSARSVAWRRLSALRAATAAGLAGLFGASWSHARRPSRSS